jgi:hypothetical protein
MKLADVASYFDQTVAVDAYTGRNPIKLQLDLYDDSKRDGVTVERRIISLANGVKIPARGVVRFAETEWVVGRLNRDVFSGEVIRQKAIVQAADGLAQVRTAAQLLAAAPGTEAYAARAWEKSAKEIDESSEMFDVYSIFMHASEAVVEGQFISLSGELHVVRDVFTTEAGFKSALAEVVETAVEDATYRSRVLNPVTEAWTPTDTSIKALQLRWQTWYRYDSRASERFLEGDEVIVVQSEVPAKANDQLVRSGVVWRVLSVDTVYGAKTLQVRRVA